MAVTFTYKATTFDYSVDKEETNPYGSFQVDVADDDAFWAEVDKQLPEYVDVLEVMRND